MRFICICIGFTICILQGAFNTAAQDQWYDPDLKQLDKTVLINIDSVTHSGIEPTLEEFINLLTEEGYVVVLHKVRETHADSLRSYMQSLYREQPSLNGAIFIGTFPKAFLHVKFPSVENRIPVMTMEFYQDLDGEYPTINHPDYVQSYGSHYGEVKSEIWSSVIPAVGDSMESINSIQNYLERNIAYRKKQKSAIRIGHLEPIIGHQELDVWQIQIDEFTKKGTFQLRNGNLSITRDNVQRTNPNYPDARFSYLNEVNTFLFDFFDIGGHGNYYGYSHENPSITIDIPWAEDNPVYPFFINSGTCSAGEYFRFPEIGSVATSFLFHPDGNVLIFNTATAVSYGGYQMDEGTWSNVLIANLGNGLSWGEASLYNFQQDVTPKSLEGGRSRDVYSANRILLGDGTLRFQEFMDYSGNDLPYILGQEFVSIPMNGVYQLSFTDLHVSDLDNTIDEQSIIVNEGSNYTVSNDSIIPKRDFKGYLNVPIRLYDGTEEGPVFNLLIQVKPQVGCTEILAVDWNNTFREDAMTKFMEQINHDLPGRFYDFATDPIANETDTGNYININLKARGTEVGEVFDQTIYLILPEELIDNDCDGFNLDEDCDDLNDLIHPGLAEIPYNGLDDDCNNETYDDDLDKDGYGIDVDCNDLSGFINPGRDEIPNNGVDENCDGNDLVVSSIEDMNDDVEVYPNPTSDFLYVKTSFSEYTVSVMDLSGRTLLKLEKPNFINLNGFQAGNYLMVLQSEPGGNVHYQRIVIR